MSTIVLNIPEMANIPPPPPDISFFWISQDDTLKMGPYYFMCILSDIRDIDQYIVMIYHPNISADNVHFFQLSF